MRKFSLALAATLAIAALSHTASVSADSFGLGKPEEFIARNSIVANIVQSSFTDRHDVDVLYISTCQGDDKLTASAVRFQISEEPARLDEVVLTYGNGQRERLNIRGHFAKNSSSRWVYLSGGSRCIKEVRLEGEATGRRGENAGTRLQAILDYNDGGWNPRGTKMALAFTVLAPRGSTWNLPVGTCENMNERVTALKLIIGVQSAEINQVRVTYGNGEVDELPVRGRYRRGDHSGWVDVLGRERCIKSIRLVGRTTSGNGPYASVLVAARLQER